MSDRRSESADREEENEESFNIIIDPPDEKSVGETESQGQIEEDHDEGGKATEIVPANKARRIGTTIAPPVTDLPGKRKISFADQKDQKATLHLSDESQREGDLPDIDEASFPQTAETAPEEREEDKDKLSKLQKREMRFSTASRFSIASRPSFAGLGLSSRPSMASLKSAFSKVNLEMYPERGSFIANRLSQSFVDMPRIAEKIYIITQILAAISVSVGSMAVGFTGGYTSTAFASMNETGGTLNLSEDEKSWVVSLAPLSAMVGSIIGGYLVDALGRKMLILLCGPPFLAGWIIIGSAYNAWMMYVGRIICGLCVGLLTLSLPVYLGETIQPEIRGTLGLLPTTFGNCGILISFIVGTYVKWSTLAYIGATIPFLFFCMMIFVPETPRWYVSKGREDHAEKSLQWLRGTDADVEIELTAIQDNYERSLQEASTLKDLLCKRYLKPFGLAIGLMLVQQMSGINAVISYTVQIFQYAGSSLNGHLCTIIVGVVNALSTFVANALIDKLGRKILLYISAIAMIVSLIALGVYFLIKDTIKIDENIIAELYWLPLVSLMVYVIAFSLGWGPIPWLFMGEALPAKVRGPAASVVTAFNWCSSFIITKTFTDFKEAIGLGGVFFLYGGVVLFGLIFTFLLIPETKGKTLEEIEDEMSGEKTSARLRRISEMSGIYIK